MENAGVSWSWFSYTVGFCIGLATASIAAFIGFKTAMDNTKQKLREGFKKSIEYDQKRI